MSVISLPSTRRVMWNRLAPGRYAITNRSGFVVAIIVVGVRRG